MSKAAEKPLVLQIESLAYGGAGIARLNDGKVVFVAGAVPKDQLAVRLTADNGRYAQAVIEEVVEPSPARVAAQCPHHSSCGGCGLQFVSLEQQRFWKRRFVVDALTRIAGINDADELVAPTLGADAPWHFRNKVEMQPLCDGRRLRLGFHAQHSQEVIAVDSCKLLPAPFADAPKRLAGALGFAFKDRLDSLCRVGLRVSANQRHSELALWTRPGACNRSLVAKIVNGSLSTTSLVRVLVRGDSAKRDIRGQELLAGRGYWQEKLAGRWLKVSAPSFFQSNTDATEILITELMRLIGNAGISLPGCKVHDLYCGLGTFTLPLAGAGAEVTAVEMTKSSLRDLSRNLDEHQLDAEVLGGGVEYLLPTLPQAELTIVDPPRSGLSKAARQALLAAAPACLAYVSCDPNTLARDLKAFIDKGYSLKAANPVDLFPQSYHIETVALLSRL